MKLTKILEFVKTKQLRLPWWLEIITASPHCVYYFGPFPSSKKAELAQAGYIEDLMEEGAQGITAQVKRCKPIDLTIFEEELEDSNHEVPQPLRGLNPL